jgi:hypothetical protein
MWHNSTDHFPDDRKTIRMPKGAEKENQQNIRGQPLAQRHSGHSPIKD